MIFFLSNMAIHGKLNVSIQSIDMYRLRQISQQPRPYPASSNFTERERHTAPSGDGGNFDALNLTPSAWGAVTLAGLQPSRLRISVRRVTTKRRRQDDEREQ